MRRKTNETLASRTVSGLRTRYFPRSRLGQGLLSLAPWLNIVLLLIMFAILDKRLMLQPGVAVSLPNMAFTDGTQTPLVMVVLARPASLARGPQELVFFDDKRFIVSEKDEMKELQNVLARSMKKYSQTTLLIQADKLVSHGTIVALYEMAREVGIKQTSIGGNPGE